MDHITTMLRTLEQLEAQYTLRRGPDQAKEEAIPESVQAQLAAIDAALSARPGRDGRRDRAAQEAVQGERLCLWPYGQGRRLYTATYVVGRVSWDNAFLQGYGAHFRIEILQGCKEGQPYVILRKGDKIGGAMSEEQQPRRWEVHAIGPRTNRV